MGAGAAAGAGAVGAGRKRQARDEEDDEEGDEDAGGELDALLDAGVIAVDAKGSLQLVEAREDVAAAPAAAAVAAAAAGAAAAEPKFGPQIASNHEKRRLRAPVRLDE